MSRPSRLGRQDPASEADCNSLFRRQIDEAAAVAPFANLAYMASLVVILTYTVPPGRQTLRWLGGALIFLVLANSIRVWIPLRWRPSKHTPRYDYVGLLVEVIVVATLDVTLFALLFHDMDVFRDLVLIATMAGIMGAGTVTFSSLRSVSLTWIYIHGLGVFTVLVVHAEPHFRILAIQLCIYMFALTVGAVYLSASFQRRCLAEFQAESERQTVALLLDGFEGGSRDWLWECDTNGRFSHTSARLAEVAGMTVDELQQLTFGQLLTRLQIASSPEGRAAAAQMIDKLESSAPFRDTVVPVHVDGRRRWWSLSGNPRVLESGVILGWRGVGSDITERYVHEQEILRLAATDSLTGLPNRRAFGVALEEAIDSRAPEKQVLVGILDLDNFKSVNDTLGHPIGDQLLLEVTKRLRDMIGSDMCSRMGGDEFGLIVCTSSRDDPGVIFDRYLEVLHEPFFVEGNRIEVRATIGYSSAPEDSTDADGLVMLADLALYEAKSTGRNRVGKFSPLLRARASARATALHELDRGIEEGQFDLHYQPQVDTQTGEVVAFEALLRWNHPSRGLIGPSQFISVAEETGMIIPLGAQAMAMATAAAAGWPTGIGVSVNVSPVQLVSREFGAMVKKALTDSGLPPQLLQLEITETGVVDDRAIRDLYKLRELGVTVALDDFGTGYSSFATLQRLPIDVLKIDRMLVTDSDDPKMSVVKSIVELAAALGMKSLAEGVETIEQFRRVQWVGCDLVQGYHISKALTAERVDVYLAATDTETGRSVHPLTWL